MLGQNFRTMGLISVFSTLFFCPVRFAYKRLASTSLTRRTITTTSSVLFALLLFSCSSNYAVSRHTTTSIRRMPQINRIETGRPLEKGTFSASVNASFAKNKPNVLHITDSSFESENDMFGGRIERTTTSDVYCYESSMMLGGECLYAFTNVFSAGLSLDASLGELYGTRLTRDKTIFNDNIELTMFVKFAKKNGRVTLSMRPEMIFEDLYGDKISVDSGYASNKTYTEKVNHHLLAFRFFSAARFDVFDNLTPFLGIHIKSQPYPMADDHFGYEVAYGLYGGIDFHQTYFALSPFIAVPLGSSINHYKSPISGGIQLAVNLFPKGKE
jgi:hypothetical protein